MEAQGIFAALRTTYGGISSQMKRLEVISENIANAESLPDENGDVYKRKVAVLKDGPVGNPASFGKKLALKMNQSSDKHLSTGRSDLRMGNTSLTDPVQHDVLEVEGEKLIHDPTHPRADENGYVRMPNVNVIEEMVDLMATNRAYEANLTVINTSKTMAKRTFEI